MAYKLLYDSDSILRLADGVTFLGGSGGSEDQEYQAWLGLGNTPQAADGLTPEQVAREVVQAEANEFTDLPEWAGYTTTEAVDAIHAAILAGDTLAQAQAKIDALPATIAGMRTGLKAVAAEMVTIRGIMEKMAKAVVYLRDRTG